MGWLSDLRLARARLEGSGLALVVVRGSEVLFESRDRGVLPFVRAVDSLGHLMSGSAVADRVVGRAVAMLCAYAGVRAVYAPVLSVGARRVLEGRGIHVEWGELVEGILSASRDAPCPFEMAVAGVDDPGEAYRVVRELLASSASARRCGGPARR